MCDANMDFRTLLAVKRAVQFFREEEKTVGISFWLLLASKTRLLYFLQISSQFGSIHLLISLDLSSGLCILESTMMSTATKTTATSSSAGDPLKSQSLSAASHQKTAKAKSDDPKPKQPLSAYNIYL